MTATASGGGVATVPAVIASGPAGDEPDPPERASAGEPAIASLQALGPPAPVNRRRQISTALLVLGALLLVVAIVLAL